MSVIDFNAFAKDAEIKNRKNELINDKRRKTRRRIEDLHLAKQLGIDVTELH